MRRAADHAGTLAKPDACLLHFSIRPHVEGEAISESPPSMWSQPCVVQCRCLGWERALVWREGGGDAADWKRGVAVEATGINYLVRSISVLYDVPR